VIVKAGIDSKVKRFLEEVSKHGRFPTMTTNYQLSQGVLVEPQRNTRTGAALLRRARHANRSRGTQLVVVEAFLLGMGHESPLQQQDAVLSLPLQQA